MRFPIYRSAQRGSGALVGLGNDTVSSAKRSQKYIPWASLWNVTPLWEAFVGHEAPIRWSDMFEIPSQPLFDITWVEMDRTGESMAALVLYDEDRREAELHGYIPHSGRTLYLPINARLHFQSDGTLYEMPVLEGDSRDGEIEAHIRPVMESLVELSFTAFAFSHCKNVELVERLPKRHEQREAKRKGEPILKYHEIVIDPGKTKQVAIGAGSASQDHPSRALHIARGHFATYTEDKPLFGKYTGTFWRPAHVRGSAELGAVKSTYKVKPA